MKSKYYEKLPDGVCIGAFPNPIENGIGRWELRVIGEGKGEHRKIHRKNYGERLFKEKP